MKLEETNHSYYCIDANYYVNGRENHGLSEYQTWEEFKADWFWKDCFNDDFNHCFRFDISKHEPSDDDSREIEFQEGYRLHLYIIKQRKGIFEPVCIHNIYEEDMFEINEFLKDRYEYLQKQWIEFSSKEK